MKVNTALAALLLALALGGCSTAPTITTPSATATTATAAATQTQEQPTPQTTNTAAFGDTATFHNGLQVTATASTVKAGQYAANAVEGTILVITLKIVNTSTETINAAFTSLPNVTVGAAGTTAAAAFDQAIALETVGNMLPGETRTTHSGYGVAAANLTNVRVEIPSPDPTENAAIFKGAVK